MRNHKDHADKEREARAKWEVANTRKLANYLMDKLTGVILNARSPHGARHRYVLTTCTLQNNDSENVEMGRILEQYIYCTSFKQVKMCLFRVYLTRCRTLYFIDDIYI